MMNSEISLSSSEELGRAWDSIDAHLRERGSFIFEAGAIGGDVEWLDNANWASFLSVAEHLGCTLVYRARADVDADTLKQLHDAINAAAAADDLDENDRRRMEGALELATGAMGQPARIELGFAYAGVIHRWSAETDWLLVIDSMIEDFLNPRGSRRRQFAEETSGFDSAYGAIRDSLNEWVNTTVDRLANDQAFVAGANQGKRRAAAMSLVPELKTWMDIDYDSVSSQDRARQRVAYDVLEKAEERLIDLRETRVADAKSNLSALVADLVQHREFIEARTVDARRRLVNDFVASRLGFPSADVRDRLLSLAMNRIHR